MSVRKLAGVVVALALAGALSAGVASGVERIRGKARKRPEPPPPFSQRDEARPRVDTKKVPPPHTPPLPPDRPGAPDVRVSSPSPGGRGGRSAEAGAWSQRVAWSGGGAPDASPSRESSEPSENTDGHAHAGWGRGLTARIPAPMRVGWTVVESSAGQVRLLAEVERRMGFGAPVTVSLSLPGEAVLLEGPVHFTVPEGAGGDVRTVSYVVSFGAGAPPAEDLVLVAHAEGTSFGAHAEERYSFGREPAAGPRPVPEGPMLPVSLLMGEESGADESADEESPH